MIQKYSVPTDIQTNYHTSLHSRGGNSSGIGGTNTPLSIFPMND
jgi:hypothetical protein